MLKISAIICTFHRPGTLGQAIGSLCNQSLSPDEYEIIVVDNNSQDQTPNIVKPYIQNSAPKVHYIVEKKQGLSHARNTGVAFSQASVVSFIDDDAVADVNWLAEILEVYDQSPNVAAVGGKIIPQWDEPPPAWFNEKFAGYLSIIDWGEETRVLSWPERILGTNSSFKKEILEALGGFDVNLGRRGNLLMGAEETMLQKAIMDTGGVVIYTPKAIVHHRISSRRLSDKYLLRLAYGNGRTDAFLQGQKGIFSSLFGRTKYMLKLLFWSLPFSWLKRDRETPRKIFLRLAYNLGFMVRKLQYVLLVSER